MKEEENLIEKWLDNTLTEAELNSLETSSEFVSFKKIDAIAQQYKAPAFDPSESLKSIQAQKKQARKKNLMYSYAGSIAAILVVVLGVFFILKGNNLEAHYAANGVKENLTLPDTSQVNINSGSEISFSDEDWQNNRTVNLKGEAYFKVEKGNVFKVASSQGVVTVLGTEFTVKDRNNYFEVTCYEGLVSVQVENKSYKLPAGNTFKIVNGVVNEQTIIEVEPAWISEISIFKSTPLLFVLEELERQYDVTVSTKDIDTTLIFTGSFTHKNIDVALQSITMPLSLKFEVRDNTIILKN